MVGVADIPQPRGVIKAAGGQGAPVRTECHRLDGVGVAGEGAQCGGVVGVADFPQPCGVIGAGGGQGVPVGTECHRIDVVCVAGEGAQCGGRWGSRHPTTARCHRN